MRVITGVLRPRSGAVTRAGAAVFATAPALKAHRKTLGWLPQEPGLPGAMTVSSLISYAAWLRLMPPSARAVAVEEALARVDLTDHRHRRLGQLSGGQRRRAALAAAIVGTPSLLLLDEPTSGLDPLQRERLLGRVREFSVGSTVVLATHLLEDVALVADRWCLLGSGRVLASGRVDRSGVAATAESMAVLRRTLSAAEGPE